MTYIRAWMSLKFGQIRPQTTELAALERQKKNPHILIMAKTMSLFFDPIFFILAGNKNIHKCLNEFEFRPDPTTDYGVSCH